MNTYVVTNNHNLPCRVEASDFEVIGVNQAVQFTDETGRVVAYFAYPFSIVLDFNTGA